MQYWFKKYAIGRSNVLENNKLYLLAPSHTPDLNEIYFKICSLVSALSLLSYISISSDSLKVNHECDTLD